MNDDLERYLNEGKLPTCSNCHKHDGVKAKSERIGFKDGKLEMYLVWLCRDCLESSGEHIRKPLFCLHCGKNIGRKMYVYDPDIIYCSKKCAKELLDDCICITKDSVCPNCKKPFNRDDLYFHDENVYCSHECAEEYEGYHDIDHWNKVLAEDDGVIIHIS